MIVQYGRPSAGNGSPIAALAEGVGAFRNGPHGSLRAPAILLDLESGSCLRLAGVLAPKVPRIMPCPREKKTWRFLLRRVAQLVRALP